MTISMFKAISNFISGINVDEEAQSVVDEVNETIENIQKSNESNLTGQGSEAPISDIAPLEEIEEMEEDNDTSPPPEDDIPIENPQDNICTNNPDDTSCDKAIVDAYFAKKGQAGVPTGTTHDYKLNGSYDVGFEVSQKLIDKIAKEIKAAITLNSEDIVLSMAGIDKVGKAQINKDLTFNAKYSETNLSITYIYNSSLYDISTDALKQSVANTTQPHAIKGFLVETSSIKTALTTANKDKYEIGDTLSNIQIQYKQKSTSSTVNVATVNYTFEDSELVKEGTKQRKKIVNIIVNNINVKEKAKTTKYFTNSEAVDAVMPEKIYGKNPPVGKEQTELKVELYKYISKYTKITKANLGSKVYLVAETKNFRNGTSVIFKMYENGDKLLKDYVVESSNELPFLHGTTQKTEILVPVKTEDVDNPETGNALEGRAVVEIALRPKKDKPDNDTDTSANLEDWKKKFKKAETDTKDKEDKLYLKVSTTSYPEVEEEEFLVGDELVVKNGECQITVTLIEKATGKNGSWFAYKNMKSYSETYKVDKEKFTEVLNEKLLKYNIQTCYEKAHFLAQVFHESDHFNTLEEYASGWDYDYSTHEDGYNRYKDNPTLYKGYKKNSVYKSSTYERFKNSENVNELLMYQKHMEYKKYVKDKRHYNRYKQCLKNNNKSVGDGPKYKGKGLIQLTWKGNYEKYKKFSNVDVVGNPELLVSTIENSIDAACWFWRYNGGIHKKYSAKGDINVLIKNDKYNVKLITLAVNGGSRGLNGRKKIFKKLKKEWKL